MPRPLRAADGLAVAILFTVAGSLTVPLLAQTRNKAGRAKSAEQQARIVVPRPNTPTTPTARRSPPTRWRFR
jgi:hypothetical protein